MRDVAATTQRDLFAELYPALRRFAAIVGPAHVEPDDLVQDALARTLRRGPLTDLDDPLTYLRRVVLRLASNHRRQFARRRDIDERRPPVDRPAEDAHRWDVEELFALPVDQRAVIYLHVVERWSHDEIAGLLQISAEASRSRLSRGLKRLRLDRSPEEAAP